MRAHVHVHTHTHTHTYTHAHTCEGDFMKKFLPFLILISALTVSGSAAFYSVFGLGKLFAGASLQVMIMAGSLEVAKLIIATALHRYWSDINLLMKSYLTTAVITLVVITSAGIYGFLSSAYQETAAKDSIVTKEIGILELKKDRFQKNLDEYVEEKNQVVKNISDLRTSLATPNQIQYIDRETGQLVTTTSSSARKSLESQLEDATTRRNSISKKIEELTDSVTRLEISVVEAQANSETGSELGSLKYISDLTGYEMNTVVNWFIFLLIFVFDPLAVTMVILANYSFGKVYGSQPIESIVGSKIDSKAKKKPVERFSNENDVLKPEETINPTQSNYVDSFDRSDDPLYTNDQDDVLSLKDKTRKITGDDMKNIIDSDLKNITENIKKNINLTQDLTDSQKRNMTSHEIEEWYKKLHNKKS